MTSWEKREQTAAAAFHDLTIVTKMVLETHPEEGHPKLYCELSCKGTSNPTNCPPLRGHLEFTKPYWFQLDECVAEAAEAAGVTRSVQLCGRALCARVDSLTT